MPFLALRHSNVESAVQDMDAADAIIDRSRLDSFGLGLIARCANPGCRSGWLHLFRNRSRPVFEGGWTCSPECTEARVQAAVRREFEAGTSSRESHRHRIPLGLLMLEKGWITGHQLRAALDAQRASGCGRLGEWLIRQNATDERKVTRALGLQWSCPVLSLSSPAPETLTSVMPRLFIDAMGVLPVRVVGRKILYLGFEERLDPVLALAVERVMGFQVESGIVASSVFRPTLTAMLACEFARVQLADATSEYAAARLMAKAVERAQPFDARLVRVHDFLWLRLFLSSHRRDVPGISSISDMVCTVRR